MLASNEVKSLVIAMGTSIADTFNIENIRYKKIIIATDADVDGAHIRTLLLTLFYRYFRPVIDAGYIYIAQPPLYKIKKGKEIAYAYSDDQKRTITGIEEDIVEESEDSETEPEVESEEEEMTKIAKGQKITIQRYKGLGEMNAEELWETTMDPARRVMKQVSVDDAEEADKVFDMLMGIEVGPRKSFIQGNARTANLDI